MQDHQTPSDPLPYNLSTGVRTLFQPVNSYREASGGLLLFLGWLAVSAIGAFYLSPNPALHGTHRKLGLPPCIVPALTNRPCPGCGLTTSWTAILHGDLSLAFRAHLLGPVLYAVFTLAAIACLIAFTRKIKVDTNNKIGNRFFMAIFFILLGYGIFRFATFEYPRPGTTASATHVCDSPLCLH